MKHHNVPHKDIQLLCVNWKETEIERKGEREKEREGEREEGLYPSSAFLWSTYLTDGPTEYCGGWVSLTEAGQAAPVCHGRVSSTWACRSPAPREQPAFGSALRSIWYAWPPHLRTGWPSGHLHAMVSRGILEELNREARDWVSVKMSPPHRVYP